MTSALTKATSLAACFQRDHPGCGGKGSCLDLMHDLRGPAAVDQNHKDTRIQRWCLAGVRINDDGRRRTRSITNGGLACV